MKKLDVSLKYAICVSLAALMLCSCGKTVQNGESSDKYLNPGATVSKKTRNDRGL